MKIVKIADVDREALTGDAVSIIKAETASTSKMSFLDEELPNS